MASNTIGMYVWNYNDEGGDVEERERERERERETDLSSVVLGQLVFLGNRLDL